METYTFIHTQRHMPTSQIKAILRNVAFWPKAGMPSSLKGIGIEYQKTT